MRKSLLKNYKAYSLIELSIVLVVISVLVSGALMVSTENLKREQVNDTKARMDRIYSALARHIRVSRSLPCPARLDRIKSSDADYGSSQADGTCAGVSASGNLVWGAVPSQLLGIPYDMSEDAFGSKIIYFVDRRFTAGANLNLSPDFSVNNFSTMGYNQLSTAPQSLWTIQQRVGNSIQTISNSAVFGLISAGPNKNGSYNANSSVQNTPPAGVDADETTNYSPTTAVVFSSSNGGTFDDLVFFKTFRNLMNDFPDFKNLIPCRNSDLSSVTMNNGVSYNSTFFDTTGTTNNAWFDGVTYSKKLGISICPQNPELRFSFKCSEAGRWVPVVSSCQAAIGGCDITTNTNYGQGAFYSGQNRSLTSGETVQIQCRSGFGRIIDGVTKSSNSSSQTCGNSSTDRSNTLIPSLVCSNGALQVINDCTACRDCSNDSDYSSGSNPLASRDHSCNDDYQAYVSEIIEECRSRPGSRSNPSYWFAPYDRSDGDNGFDNRQRTFSVDHQSSVIIAHRHRRRCNCDSDDRTVCVYVNMICRDGINFYQNWWGESADGNSNVDLDYDCRQGSTPVYECGTTSQPRGNC